MHSCSSSRCGCLDRRQFLKLSTTAAFSLALGSPAGAIAGPFQPKDTADHFVPADKKLTGAWLATLINKGEPEWYQGDDLKQIGMPVGGICAGQLYLSGDGRLTHWDIFNDSPEDARSGTHYQTMPPAAARVEQSFAIQVRIGGQTFTRSLDKTGFPDVRFRGEYPIGIVQYNDPDFPASIRMQAFSPFIPLNSIESALPATILQFSVRNTRKEKIELHLAGSLQNAACHRSGTVLAGTRENRFIKAENISMIFGSARSALVEPQPARPVIVLANFEQRDYGAWQAEGEAFGAGPAPGTLLNQQKVSGYQGTGLVNTYLGGDKAQGKLTSPPFKIERRFINFLVGGGAHENQTCVNLLAGGKKVRSATGRNNERLRWQSWDVSELEGQEARVEIVDRHSGGWGHINVDQIELSDNPRRTFEGGLEDQPDFGTMCLGILGDDSRIEVITDLAGATLQSGLSTTPGKRKGTATPREPSTKPFGEALIGALGTRRTLNPGEETTVTFLITWHFPNLSPLGNRYAGRFANAGAVAHHVARNFERLTSETRLWHDTWYDSTLPWWLLDRLFAPTSILASATCQWWGNGRFWAWEGVRCCAGTCAHVWNYSHALARLFPDLERSIREMQDFGPGFVESTGAINFRGESNDFWAGDSQGGTAMKCLREHHMSRDDSFLRRNWPWIRKSVEFLMQEDGNSDGLIEGSQHNTYDINFFGANTMVGSLYLGALRAAEELAVEVGDLDFAGKCRRVFETGSKLTVEKLFNGEYFFQAVDLEKHPQHQYGEGCLSDQLFGQGWAHQVGLGYLYPREKVLAALKAIWIYNWAPDIGPQNEAHPPQRWFAKPGEAGLFTCTWPKSKHLGPQSVLYRDEIWTGIEYQVAGHMIWEGMVGEALAICRGVHERYHPAKQNPWNEVECGDHYARAMASYGVFLALCGFECHGPKRHLNFAPRMNPENFRASFTTAEGWGTFSQKRDNRQLTGNILLKWGKLPMRSLSLAIPEGRELKECVLELAGKRLKARFSQHGTRVTIQLEREILLQAGEAIEASLKYEL